MINERILQNKRKQLIEQLREKGISDEDVLSAISRVDRHQFIDTALHHRAYDDRALPILGKQTISQPFTVAFQTQLLDLKKNEKVLEIGTGSGYQCAVLCELCNNVFSIERLDELYQMARENLTELNYRPRLKLGDGTEGWSAYAPYDAIIVTAGAPVVPDKLKEQLTVGGRLVIPVGDRNSQRMLRLTRTNENTFKEEDFHGFKFVPLIGKDGW